MKKNGEQWSLFRLSDRIQFDNVSLDTIDFFFRALNEKSRVDWLMWREGFAGWRPFSELSLILKHLEAPEKDMPAPPPVPEAVLNLSRTGFLNVEPGERAEGSSAHAEPAEHAEHWDASAKTHSSVSHRAIQATLRLKSEGSHPKRFSSVTPTPSVDRKTESVSGRTPSVLKENGKVIEIGNEAALSLMLESQAATEDRLTTRYPRRFRVRIHTPQGILAMYTEDCSTTGFRLQQPLPAGLPRFFHVEIDLGLDGKIPVVCSEIREKDGRASTRVRIQVNDHIATLKAALVRIA